MKLAGSPSLTNWSARGEIIFGAIGGSCTVDSLGFLVVGGAIVSDHTSSGHMVDYVYQLYGIVVAFTVGTQSP